MAGGMLQIGEVAERVGLSLRTVRYYEETGLLAPARRSVGGFRLYTEDHVERLRFITRLKPLAFRVDEIRELLDARDALDAADTGEEERFLARESLRRFAANASARCDELRRRLDAAEELAGQLRREARRAPVGAEH